MGVKKFFGGYFFPKKKFDDIMQFIASEDKEVIAVGAAMLKKEMSITGPITRTSISSLRIDDEISWSTEDEDNNTYLETAKVISIGSKNIVVERENKKISSIIKTNLEKDPHFSIISQ